MIKIKNYLILFLFLVTSLSGQRQLSNRKQENLDQYQFSVFSIADLKSDSISILSYLTLPNNVLKFVKDNNEFISSYEATISLKEKKGSLIGRKNWTNTLKTANYF